VRAYRSLITPHPQSRLEEVAKKSIKTLSKKIVPALLPIEVADILSRDTKIIYKNRPSVARVLVNNTKTNLDPDNPPQCLGLPYCTEETHYSKRIRQKMGQSQIHSSPTRQKFGEE